MALCPVAFARRSLSSVEWQQSNIYREALGILHWLEKFHHCCFAKEVHVITDDKPLLAMISKDVMMLSQWLECIMLCIHQYSVGILYKSSPKAYIVDWISCHNHVESQDQEIPGMNISLYMISPSVDIPVCTSVDEIKAATEEDAELQMLQNYIIRQWLHAMEVVEPGQKRHELIMMDSVVMEGQCLIIPCLLQKQILEQLHSNYMGIKKTHLLVKESVYWVNMNTNIEQTVKQCSMYLEYQCTQCYTMIYHANPER